MRKKPYVIALNIEKSINEKLIDIRVACHQARIFSDYPSYKHFKKKIVLPLASQDTEIKENLKKIKVKNFGFTVRKEKFKFFNTYAISPSILAIAYALSIANSGKAKNVNLAGFDGYSDNETLNSEMNELLKVYNSNKKAIKIHSITPTKYRLDTKSLFAI